MTEHWRFSLLGPVRAWKGEEEVDLGSRQQKVVLAMLLLRARVVVSMDQLIDGLWDEEPPMSAAQTVRTYIYRLRRILSGSPGAPSIRTVGGGYVLDVEPGDVDLDVVRHQLSLAEKLPEAADPAQARDLLVAALTRWPGEALAGLPGEYVRGQRSELARLRLDLLEHVLSLEVRLGASGVVIGEISAAVAENPLDERFRRLLMLALYHTGQQAQALAVYRDTQVVLADELGVDPGPLLQELHLQILRADPPPGAVERPVVSTVGPKVAPTTVPPNQLPPGPRGFTGRAAELVRLDTMLAEGSQTAPGAVLLHGMAGSGKTALAVHWAHRVADQFPDGLVYLNLRGFDPSGSSISGAEALPLILRTLDSQQVPDCVGTQTTLYRNLLAGRRMLILLDNARDAEQIRLLLPGVPGIFVLITSRTQMTSLIARDQAQALSVDALGEDDARAMVTERLGPRPDLDRAAVAGIIAHSGGLPLALTLITARAALCPLPALWEEMNSPGGVLDAFSDPDPTIDVRSAFSWSYRYLGPETARIFRLMSTTTCSPLSLAMVVSRAGRPVRTVRAALSELVVAHLIERVGPDQFALHDLLRAYATELAAAEGDWTVGAPSPTLRLLDAVGH
jgi:DNA-binding SARP family transcriptional activator